MRFGSTIRFLIAGVLLTSSAHAGETRKQTLKSHPMRRAYVKDTFGPAGMGRVAAGAALRRGKGSYGQHLVTSFEGHVAGKTVEYGVASMRHEDLHYHRSIRRGFGPRMRHALVSTVVTRKTTSGKRTVASGRISGAAVAGLVAGSAATGGVALGADAGVNIAKEFWPRKRRQVSRTPHTPSPSHSVTARQQG